MSRYRTRARGRRARFEEAVAEFKQLRADPEAFRAFLIRLRESKFCVKKVAKAASIDWLQSDDEVAMIDQIVAPHLAGMTPGAVHKRRGLGQ
jgi:hypothetical protein